MNKFEYIIQEIIPLINKWEPILFTLPKSIISQNRNNQKRTIKQIVGHMVDSASNNTHRIVHLQYQDSPLEFPNYATFGNNDLWIAIQNYQEENWKELVLFWKYSHLHIVHVIQQIDIGKLGNQWMSGSNSFISLEEMVNDFPRHFKLHLDEIDQLMK